MYVDDIILTGDDENEISWLKTCLAIEFEIKDLESLKYFPRMKVAWFKRGIAVFQWKYILDLLKEIRMSGYKPIDTLIDPNKKLEDNKQRDPIDTTQY